MTTSNIELALVRLQTYVKAHDVSRVDAPVSVGLMASGQMYCSHSLSVEPVMVAGLADAATHINSWLDQHQQS